MRILLGGRGAACLGALWLVACGASGGATPNDGGVVDAGPGTDTGPVITPDAGGGTGEVGAPCRAHGDCAEGYCVDAAGVGGVCSRECGDGCPSEWSCREVDVLEEARELCVPLLGDHCLRCASDDECVSGACLAIDGARHCAPRCVNDEACPAGYVCRPDAGGAHEGGFCQPVSGSCSCDERMAGATRTCANANDTGTCWGTQTCDPATGWSGCDAREASPEVCDGTDNDCNFVIDDGVDTGETCVNTVEGVGSCPGVEVCGGEAGFVCQGPIPTPERCNYVDDDCDGSIDEDFPDVGQVCEAGVGACLAFGAIRCRADGMGTECSAVAGTPRPERCSGRDDDCDGSIDEDFPTLGQGCSAGVGACERFGTVVCSADELATRCSATAGAPSVELCNYRDDDCNGVVDDGFRDAATGLYDRDGACGSCDIDCGVVFAGAPNAVGRCQVLGGAPVCVIGCVAGAFDLNGSALDGCEFVLDADVIYVSRTATSAADDAGCGLGPMGTGAGRYPCRSIGQGLARAAALGRGAVWVADGTYDEAVTLRDGIDLLGGFRADTWEREAEVTATVIQGVSSVGVHDRTVIAEGITSPTLFEGFLVQGAFNAKPGGNSYALYLSASSSALVVRGNFIYAGRGGSGAAGAPGANGAAGANGTGRDSPGVDPADYDARVTVGGTRCAASNSRTFTNGGARVCAGDDVSGGRGGGVTCPPSSTRIQQSAGNGVAGQPGAAPGGGAAGGGGAGGHDGELIRISGSVSCLVPTGGPLFGEDGGNGTLGANAAGTGVGC
ncbi:MAG: hypothetical protein KF901_28635, partial [Myxococcales bacterium]|nr:hypothetical protein [Myxococcales bacterium]